MKETGKHLVEYKVVPAWNETKENEDRLNSLAQQGWRLDGVLAPKQHGPGQFILVRRVDNG